ncbi:MAG: hypothetical protein JWQ83_1386 [Lacunisphaera sp.]|jgi:hypothetical protein|nr:hypothetical protein [Lacunisphaera sp.]MDB6166246.1 hypothetical protein [Lacunisphaera sp.]
MKTIKNTINGLASSLLLTVGLTNIAEKLDPTQFQAGTSGWAINSAEPCIAVCAFTPETGQ